MATKPTRTAAQLDALIAERFFALEEVKADMRDDSRSNPVPPTSYWHEPLQGINWAARGGSNITAYIDPLNRIVGELQQQFDMDS